MNDESLEVPQEDRKKISLAEAKEFLAEHNLQLEKEWTAITLEEARTILAEEHEIVLNENDPTCMMITIINLCLKNQEKMLDVQRIKYAETSESIIQFALDIIQQFANNQAQEGNSPISTERNNQNNTHGLWNFSKSTLSLMFICLFLLFLLILSMTGKL